ncbi:helix-turn-helix domain-containing protein [Bremerella sp. JC817]|uniref:helix-turn-helix domain-containing protein n=1 Tax=Bremerella sp. JC817 TaxID=3231756 RepID=UPI003457972C
MNTTAHANNDHSELLLWRDQLAKVLDNLPTETGEDLIDLLKMLFKEQDPTLKRQIGQAIEEILVPDSMLVDLKPEYGLENESSEVRERVDKYRRKVGKVVRELRRQKSMSQEELAERAGISQSHLSRLETGLHVPTSTTMEKIADALGVHPSQLDPGFPNE